MNKEKTLQRRLIEEADRHLNIASRLQEAASLLGEAASLNGSSPAAPVRKMRRRKMSADARERISNAMKQRWAERKKTA